MKEHDPGHNDPCACGSGKKYRLCCLPQSVDSVVAESSIDTQIEDAGKLALEHNEASVLTSIDRLLEISNRTDLTIHQRQSVQLGLTQSYQRRGEHRKALDTLKSMPECTATSHDHVFNSLTKHLAAVSYAALGQVGEAAALFSTVLAELEHCDVDPSLMASVFMEAGKVFHAQHDNQRARECWSKAMKHFTVSKDIEGTARAQANLGALQLHEADPSTQEAGVQLIESSSNTKRRIGDLEGLANNHCMLGLHYWRNRRFERSIAYLRKDLYLSRQVGDQRSVATSLCNLSGLYAELKQLTAARGLLSEALDIGSALGDDHLIQIARHNLAAVEDVGRRAGSSNERIGPGAKCACDSGKAYDACCGRADHEPVDLHIQFGGHSEDMEKIVEESGLSGGAPSRLDFILRETAQSRTRRAWSKIHVHDGWLEMKELPDMANHHLCAASALARESVAEPDAVTKPLSCVILATCALEAFINQVAFFLHDINNYPESELHSIPRELSAGALEFQRRTELTVKWEILGKSLCGNLWPPPPPLWSDVQNLVFIRNELVHFKASDYEQVVPMPKNLHAVLLRVPTSVEVRDTPHSWPARLLTPAFAQWSVTVAESAISYFRQGYSRTRKSRGTEPRAAD